MKVTSYPGNGNRGVGGFLVYPPWPKNLSEKLDCIASFTQHNKELD